MLEKQRSILRSEHLATLPSISNLVAHQVRTRMANYPDEYTTSRGNLEISIKLYRYNVNLPRFENNLCLF